MTTFYDDTVFRRTFGPVIANYRRKRAVVRELRERWNRRAPDLADAVMRHLGRDEFDTVFGDRDKEGHRPIAEQMLPPTFTRGYWERLFANPLGGTSLDEHVFDPWNQRWDGVWRDGDRRDRNYHTWDQTRPAPAPPRDGLHVQPVAMGGGSHVTPQTIDERARTGTADVGLNVWDPELGPTGWIEHGTATDPPGGAAAKEGWVFVAWRANDNTLVWLLERHTMECNRVASNEVFLMIEWVSSDGSRYRVLQRQLVDRGSGRLEPAPNTNPKGGDYTATPAPTPPPPSTPGGSGN